MDQQRSQKKVSHFWERQLISHVRVSNFKSIVEEQPMEIRPLTILAGANSSGKSSIIQPLLLLKQTLEENYDPGGLLLDGPNVKFTSVDQFLSRIKKGRTLETFTIGVSFSAEEGLTLGFRRKSDGGIDVQCATFLYRGTKINLRIGMTHEQVLEVLPLAQKDSYERSIQGMDKPLKWRVARNRGLLRIALEGEELGLNFSTGFGLLSISLEVHLRRLLHLPGLRGNPERTYPLTAVGPLFPGTFEKYVASVISQWQTTKSERLDRLSANLEKLGLTWTISASAIADTQIELKVGRLARPTQGKARDLVNITDVGFGVSQILPILVALLIAEPGQLVYLEQPEIHLHPRAQSALAQVLADAANRGVRVIAETHSSLLLLGVQTLVAEGKLAPEKVKLHWFKRDHLGNTKISSVDLDEAGAFGDWPEDFAEVSLNAKSRYLDAAEARMMRKNGYGSKGLATARH